jgi:hypothetical protein
MSLASLDGIESVWGIRAAASLYALFGEDRPVSGPRRDDAAGRSRCVSRPK